jgi:hypothetical protein
MPATLVERRSGAGEDAWAPLRAVDRSSGSSGRASSRSPFWGAHSCAERNSPRPVSVDTRMVPVCVTDIAAGGEFGDTRSEAPVLGDRRTLTAHRTKHITPTGLVPVAFWARRQARARWLSGRCSPAYRRRWGYPLRRRSPGQPYRRRPADQAVCIASPVKWIPLGAAISRVVGGVPAVRRAASFGASETAWAPSILACCSVRVPAPQGRRPPSVMRGLRRGRRRGWLGIARMPAGLRPGSPGSCVGA